MKIHTTKDPELISIMNAMKDIDRAPVEGTPEFIKVVPIPVDNDGGE